MTPKRNIDKLDLKFKTFCFARAFVKRIKRGISLVVQWLRICISTAGFMGLIPQLGTEIPHAVQSKKLNIFLKGELEDKPQSGVKKIIFQVTKLTKDFLSREYQNT